LEKCSKRHKQNTISREQSKAALDQKTLKIKLLGMNRKHDYKIEEKNINKIG
jgi:hypothetical protein